MDVKWNCTWGRGGGAKRKERGRDKSILGGKRWRCGVVKSLLELWQGKLWAGDEGTDKGLGGRGTNVKGNHYWELGRVVVRGG